MDRLIEKLFISIIVAVLVYNGHHTAAVFLTMMWLG